VSDGRRSSRAISSNRSARRHPQILERYRVEIVIGERDEPEPAAPQIHDLLEHAIDVPLPGLLAVRAPHGTERAVLRAPADRLDRRPHVAALGEQIPSARQELVALDAPACVHRRRRAGRAVAKRKGPHAFAVSGDDRVRAAQVARLVRIQRGVDAAEDDHRTSGARSRPDLVAAKRVARMDADADHVSRLDRRGIERLEGLIGQKRNAVVRRRGGRQYIQPPRRDHADAERHVTRVDQVHPHRFECPCHQPRLAIESSSAFLSPCPSPRSRASLIKALEVFMSSRFWDRPADPSPAESAPASVTACPFCSSTRVTTTEKAVSSSTYWRCEACGEIWNPARQASVPRRRAW
jgi:hypothetical protein